MDSKVLRVGWDNDGVLHNFGNGVRDYLRSIGREFGYKDGAEEPHTWNFFEYWKMEPQEFVQVCHDGVDAGYIFNNNVRPGAVEAVAKIAAMGHTNVMITDRKFGTTPEVSEKRTYDWISDNGFLFNEVYFSSDKTIVQTDCFVEDKLENYDALSKAGVKCWLINRPWNIVKGGDYRDRIDDVSEYPDKVAQLASLQYV